MELLIISVCIISLALSISDNLISGTKLGGQVKFIFSLILLTVLFSGTEITAEFPEFSDIEISQEYSEELYNNQLKIQIEKNISSALIEKLNENKINFNFIETEVNISDSNGISINKVTIGTDNFYDAERIIKENLGEETEVINGY